MTHEQAASSMASERYLLGEMGDGERDDFEEHYFSCAACADDVRLGARLANGVRAHFAEGEGMVPSSPAQPAYVPPAARASTRRARGIRRLARSPWIPWAAASALLVVVGYQNLTARAPAAAAMSLVALRPATRAAEPTDAPGVAPRDGVVPLLVEINVGSGVERLAYRIRNENGAEVLAGEAARPAASGNLLLLVPADRVNPGGRYVLSVSNAIDAAMLIGEYRFSVATSP